MRRHRTPPSSNAQSAALTAEGLAIRRRQSRSSQSAINARDAPSTSSLAHTGPCLIGQGRAAARARSRLDIAPPSPRCQRICVVQRLASRTVGQISRSPRLWSAPGERALSEFRSWRRSPPAQVERWPAEERSAGRLRAPVQPLRRLLHGPARTVPPSTRDVNCAMIRLEPRYAIWLKSMRILHNHFRQSIRIRLCEGGCAMMP